MLRPPTMWSQTRVREDMRVLHDADERKRSISHEATFSPARFNYRPIPTFQAEKHVTPVVSYDEFRERSAALEAITRKKRKSTRTATRPKKKEIAALRSVCERMNLKTTVKGSSTGGLITAAAAMIGGLFLGPLGFPIGGAIGGCADLLMKRKKSVAVSDLIEDLSDEEIEALLAYIKKHLSLLGLGDDLEINISLLKDADMQGLIAKIIIDFLREHKNMKIE